MNEKTLLKLEYDKIINLLIDQASSESGKLRCKNLKPMVDLEEIDLRIRGNIYLKYKEIIVREIRGI